MGNVISAGLGQVGKSAGIAVYCTSCATGHVQAKTSEMSMCNICLLRSCPLVCPLPPKLPFGPPLSQPIEAALWCGCRRLQGKLPLGQGCSLPQSALLSTRCAPQA